jgi:hypothetical protein
VQGLGGDVDHCQYNRLTGAAHGTRQGAEQPIGKGAGKDRIRVFKSGGLRTAGAAHQAINDWTADQQNRREDDGHSGADNDAVNDKRGCVVMAAGADGACDRGCDRSAHAGIRHLLHQHDQRKNERQSGQRIRPHLPDEMRIDRRGDGNEHDVHDDVGRRKAQQRRDDRSFKQKTCPRRHRLRCGFRCYWVSD